MDEDEIFDSASSSLDGSAKKNPIKRATVSSLVFPKGVCKVEVTKVDWNPVQPWQRLGQSRSSGTGFCIEGECILTNAHVVKSAVDIRIRFFGSTRRFLAAVEVYAPDVDLAILKLTNPRDQKAIFGSDDGDQENESLSSPSHTPPSSSPPPKKKSKTTTTSMKLEFATELPSLQETVQVVGYPTGGKTICVTEGVVSRIDVLGNGMLTIQVDSAINPGNSGGPVLNSRGQVTGVAFRKRTSAAKRVVDNIGYLIPSVVVKAFLGRIQRQRSEIPKTLPETMNTSKSIENTTTVYNLAASIPFQWHSLENQSLRMAHKVPEDVHGILITSVCESIVGTGADCLKRDDIICSIDGIDVADDGQVILRGDELIQHSYLLKIKLHNEPLHLRIWRNGKFHTCPPITSLKYIPSILPTYENVDCTPDYLILGACVFLPFTTTLGRYNECGATLKAEGIAWGRKWPEEWEGKEGLVILTTILAHELTFSYRRPWRRVTKYNGIPVQSLEHLRDLWEASCKDMLTSEPKEVATNDAIPGSVDAVPKFARLELENDNDLVFEVSAAIKAQTEILKTYEIPKQHQILKLDPRYDLSFPSTTTSNHSQESISEAR